MKVENIHRGQRSIKCKKKAKWKKRLIETIVLSEAQNFSLSLKYKKFQRIWPWKCILWMQTDHSNEKCVSCPVEIEKIKS